MPTADEVQEKVNIDVAEYASYPIEKLKPEHILKESPLRMDNPSLNFLTLSLRAYIKNYNKEQTLLAKEVKKSNMSVQLLGALVFEKIKNK